MKRRTLIRALAAGVSTGGLAGCTVRDGASPGDGNTPTGTGGTDTPGTDTDTPTPTDPSPSPSPKPGEPVLVERAFRVTENTCGQGVDRATVESGGGTVTVRGTVRGANGCYTAELERAGYDADADALTVAVRSFDPGEDAACTQCLVDIDYRAAFTFEGGLPESVIVIHNGERVAETGTDGGDETQAGTY